MGMWKSTERIPTFPQALLWNSVYEKRGTIHEDVIRTADLTFTSRFIEGTEARRFRG